jgi:hypothetical protein
MSKKKMITEPVTEKASKAPRYERPYIKSLLVKGKAYEIADLTDDDIDFLLKKHPKVSVYFQKK